MAVYWIDPHINSPIGGIHGTTGSGLGTYASPYSLVDLHNLASGSYVSGDEYRIKGLPESTYFPTQVAFASTPTTTNNGVTYVNTYNIQSADTHDLLRMKDRDTNDLIFSSADSTNRFRSVPTSSTWFSAMPQLDTTYGYYPLDVQYAITTSAIQTAIASTTFQMFRNIGSVTGITLTAGWTSETVRDGISVIHFDYSFTSGMTIDFGSNSTSNRRLIIDSPELILSGKYNSTFRAMGTDTRLRAFVSSFYAPGYTGEVYNNDNLTIPCFAGGGGNSRIFNAGTTANNFVIDIDQYVGGRQSGTYLTYSNSGASFELRLKNYNSSRIFNISNQSGGSNRLLSIPFKNGWSFEQIEQATAVTITSTFQVTENFGTKKTPAYYEGVSNVKTNTFSYLSLSGVNRAITNALNDIESDPNSVIKTINTTATVYRNFASRYIHSQTLETVDLCPLFITSTTTFGSPSKVNVLADSVSGRPCQFIPPSSGGACMLVFNSPSFNNKLLWHFFPECNGRVYADTFPLGLIDPTKDNTFQSTFITSDNPGINATFRIYMITDLGVPVLYNNIIIPQVTGNTISTSFVLDPTFIANNNSKSAFVIVEATKTNTNTANLIIESLRIVQS